jgi:hypothetical protein
LLRSPQAAWAPIDGIIDAHDERAAKRVRTGPFPDPEQSDEDVMGEESPNAHDASPDSDCSSPFPSDPEWEDVLVLPPRAAAVPSGLYTTPLHMQNEKPAGSKIQRQLPKQVVQAWPNVRSCLRSRVFHWGRPDRSADTTEDDAARTAIAWLWEVEASIKQPPVEAAIERIAGQAASSTS